MAATLTPYPPHRPQSAKRLTPAAALGNISAYLSASETAPHLHPDAQLDPREIKFSTTGGPSGGLVLHNLRRVEKGLNGEVLAPEKDELDDIFGLPAGDDARLDGLLADGGDGAQQRRKGGLKKKSAFETDAQDPIEYALSQQELVGEVGERDPAGGDAMDVDYNEDEGDATGGALTQREKEARKEEKKKRRKAEQKAKADKNASK